MHSNVRLKLMHLLLGNLRDKPRGGSEGRGPATEVTEKLLGPGSYIVQDLVYDC